MLSFLRRGLCAGVKLQFAALITSAWFSLAFAAGEEASDFLKLPSFDLEPRAMPSPLPTWQVGDQIEYQVTGQLPEQASELRLEFAPDYQTPKDAGHNLVIQDHARLVLVPLKPGAHSVPALVLKNKESKAVGRTNPFSVEVKSAIKSDDPNPSKPADAIPPIKLAFPWMVVGLLGLLALCILAGILYFLVRWSRKNRKPKAARPLPEAPRLPEDQVALTALSVLAAKNLMEAGQFKVHYFGVSEILKTYLGARFEFDAPESTADEIIRFLEDRALVSDLLLDQLESLFRRLDRVKFTDYRPSKEEGMGVILDSKKWVETTRKAEVIKPNAV